MALTDNLLTVKEALEFLRLNGVGISEIWLRVMLGSGRIPSQKLMNRRLVSRNDLATYVKKRRASQ